MFHSLLFLSLSLGPNDHEQLNPLYRELRQQGVDVGAAAPVPLPPPTLPDGLDSKKQQAILAGLAGDDFLLEDLVRNSVVAPHLFKYRDLPNTDPQAPAHIVEVWFVAYGDLDALLQKEFLQRALQSAQKERKVHLLTEEELAQRKLAHKENERYSFAEFPVLEKVMLSTTTRTVMSRTADSVIFATKLDPRFVGDPSFPNQWRSMERDSQGAVQLGKPQPYTGTAGYIKVTRLAEPPGALLVEQHMIFAEPKQWFGGANLLRSKLPLLIQNEARAFRREAVKSLPAQ